MWNVPIILLYLAAAAAYFIISDRNNILSPIKWYVWSFGFVVVTFLFAGITYSDEVSFWAVVFLLVCSGAFIGGSHWGLRRGASRKQRPTATILNSRHWQRTCAVASILGAAIYAGDQLSYESFDLGARFIGSEVSIQRQIGFMLLCLGIIPWLYHVNALSSGRRGLGWLGVGALIAYVSKDVVAAARGHSTIACAATFIVFIHGMKGLNVTSRWRRMAMVILGTALLAASGAYISFIASNREEINSRASSDKVIFLSEWFSGNVKESTLRFLDYIGPARDSVAELLFYYSHELPNLSIYYDNYSGELWYGLANFSYVSRRLKPLVGDVAASLEDSVDVAFEHGGMTVHSWGTYVKDLMMDFGRVGSPLLCVLLGLLCGYATARVRRQGTGMDLVLQAMLCTGVVFSVQGFPLGEEGWAFPVFVLIGAEAIGRWLESKRKRAFAPGRRLIITGDNAAAKV
jgi:hypothetical protein